jgi:RNA polymerase sigma-70 factor (ECF subfamily)
VTFEGARAAEIHNSLNSGHDEPAHVAATSTIDGTDSTLSPFSEPEFRRCWIVARYAAANGGVSIAGPLSRARASSRGVAVLVPIEGIVLPCHTGATGMRSFPPVVGAELASAPPGAAHTETAAATTGSEDRDLVDALARGEPWAAEEVWNRHARSVRRLMIRALGPRPEVDDLTQEVFMRVFSRIGSLRDARALREFVTAVAVNVLKGELRRRWVRRKVLLSPDGTVPDLEAPGADPEARQALARCYAILDKLGSRERAAFVLRYMEEQTLEEVAKGLGVSLRTAKRLVKRASERVSKHVGGDEGLRSFFERRESAADRPRTGATTSNNTSGKSNVNG